MKKYLIIGLGNPGEKYSGTRHNIGFDIADALAAQFEVPFESVRFGEMAKIMYKGRLILLLKPMTYMNLSGKAVRYWMQKEKIDAARTLVICDDLSLPAGVLRLKPKGGAGGHNGLQNIADLTGTTAFPRLRFGIGKDFKPGRQTDYVLGTWDEGEKAILKERIPVFAEAVLSFVFSGIEQTMNRYNGK